MQLIDIAEFIIGRACARWLAQPILRAERWVTLQPSLFERRRTLTHPTKTRFVDVFLVQRPADGLRDVALHLAFAGTNGAATSV
jgi:hypothetical protein